jgi:hypothetical protein
MSKSFEIVEKICRALEEQKLWGIHKDAEQLKLMLQEKELSDEVRPLMPTPVDCDPLEYPREIPGS